MLYFSGLNTVYICTTVGLSVSQFSVEMQNSQVVSCQCLPHCLPAYIQRRGGLAKAGGTLSVIRTTNG